MARKRRKKFKMLTFTKKFVTIITGVALIDVQLCFLLAFLDKAIPESLAIALVTEIIAIAFVYCTKAFLESYAEENNKLKKLSKQIKEEEMSLDENDDNFEEEQEC